MNSLLGIKRHYLHALWIVVPFLVCILTVRFFVISPGRVNGPSMEPTLIDEQLFFVSKFSYYFRAPQRFDVVQVIDPQTQSQYVIKRVIGMPGETIVIAKGRVYRETENGLVEFDESDYLSDYAYTVVIGQTEAKRFTLGDDEYFVLGDNRSRSTDSRHYGPVHREAIVGLVLGKSL